jgi:hypothetical protein
MYLRSRIDGSRSPVPIYSRVFDPDLTDGISEFIWTKEKTKSLSTGNSIFRLETDISYFPIDVRLVYGDGKKENKRQRSCLH